MPADLAHLLEQRIIAAVQSAYGIEITPQEAVVRPAAVGRRADYQCNAAMALAKRIGEPSIQVATAIVEHLDTTVLADRPEVAGPGFINLTFDDTYLADHVARLAADPRLGLPEPKPRRIVIDYSAPNMAKEMHVGHLRSTIIGDALVRILEHLGNEVIRENHIGDWGTPFGMLVEHLVDQGWAGGGEHTVADLTALYTEARRKFDADEAFADRCRKRVVALQAGDPHTLTLWEELLDESKRHMEAVYQLLDVRLTPDDYRGESSYNDQLADVAAELEDRGLATLSDGALCMFPPGFTGRDGEPLPLIIRKRDGGYGYAATDLATIRHRAADLHADDLLYVVGAPQATHLAMILAAARQAGWLPEHARTEHIAFGSVLGHDGRMLRTRAGATLKLTDLLTEAVDRASKVIADRSELGAEEQKQIANAVGIGAIKYADLSSHHEKDYAFSLDRMLAMDGNTSVYLQYAHARIHSIIRKADHTPPDGTAVTLTQPEERSLALILAEYPAAIAATVNYLEPHRLCGYLYDLASTFSAFYERCPVVNASTDQDRESRLALSHHTARALQRGLSLLGIAAPRAM